MVGTKWGASHHEHVQVSKRLCERTETDDAGCCVERHPCRMETCGTEEPDEGNLHVRICGGAGRAIAGSTWTRDSREFWSRLNILTERACC